MQITFLGANRQVTGSCYCLEANGSSVLVDCGLFQERAYLSRNWEPPSAAVRSCKALLLTHIHIDHSGLIPRLVGEGFRQPIFATHPTVDLADIVLRDSAHIQEEDAAYKKKRHQREGRRGAHPEVPLYTQKEVEKTLPLFQGVGYGERLKVADGIEVVYHDAGHILGSAMIEVFVQEDGKRRRVIFSGDIGQDDRPLIRDSSWFEQADYVVMESTYGNREHEAPGDINKHLCDIINQTVKQGGNVVIPTFAVERAQELLYRLSEMVYADAIPDVPVFLDSPMAIDVTDLFYKFRQYLDEEARERFTAGQNPFHFQGLRFVRSTDDSRAINDLSEPCIIMSPAGMCNAGRIKHHLRHNLGRSESTILFVGYQAEGTLGRQILDGSKFVRIHGREWKVRARIAKINGLSAHADRTALLRWLGHLKSAPRHVFLTHGEEKAALHLAERIGRQFHWPVSVPSYREVAALD
jgi:metallo-beta-lactamase family protein